jgi:hypothetical protein
MAGAVNTLPMKPNAAIPPKIRTNRLAILVLGKRRPCCQSASANLSGCLVRKPPATRIVMNSAASDGASKSPATIGSNTNPHDPCSIGSAIDFTGTDDFCLIGEVSTCISSLSVKQKPLASAAPVTSTPIILKNRSGPGHVYLRNPRKNPLKMEISREKHQ